MQGTSIHKMTQGLLKGIEAKPRICKNLMSLLKFYQNSPVSLYYPSDHSGTVFAGNVGYYRFLDGGFNHEKGNLPSRY